MPPLSFSTAAITGLLATTITTQAVPLRVAPPTWQPTPASLQLAHEGHSGAAQANGTVNAVDAVRHMVNLSHGSVKALGWPAMTMDFPVSPEVSLAALKPGMRVNFTLVRTGGGMVVDTIQPADASH